MISREEVKKLLAKKSLTGHEAGRLWMEDSFLVVRGQKGLLTEKEHRYMRSLVRTQEDIEIYNSYLELYKRAEMALSNADLLAYMAQSNFLALVLLMKDYLDRDVSSWNLPPAFGGGNQADIYTMTMTIRLPVIKDEIGKFMAYKIRMEDLSRETGVTGFIQVIEGDIDIIAYGLKRYNFYAGAPGIKAEKIILEKIRPDRQMLKFLQETVFTIRDQEASDGKEA
jgi:hypothetical protein